MKYSGKDFREFYKRIVAIEMNEQIRGLIRDFPGAMSANCVYAYGYIDHEAGFTFEVLACGKQSEKSGLYNPREGNDDISVKLRADVVEGLEIVFFSERTSYRKKFARKIEMVENYNVSEEIEETRNFAFLDESRNNIYVDDIAVFLTREGNQLERCWVRIEGLGKHTIIGTLLNEPDQVFGYHKGERIAFFVQETEDKHVICVSDMNPSRTITEEDLEDGSMLEEAVSRFNSKRNEQNFFDVLEIIRDSWVWIPCNFIMSERDEKRFMEMIGDIEEDEETLSERITGMEFAAMDETRLVPDILTNGDNFYFPIFSSEKAMEEYGDGFSKVHRHILDVLPLARNNKKEPIAIILNAFSEPFELQRDLWDVIENMKSRIVKKEE